MSLDAKLLELRDKATFIPILAVLMESAGEQEHYLLRRCGYGQGTVLLTRADGSGKAHCDPYDWCDRTFTAAHVWIEKHWDKISAGDVIDVEFILGESKAAKVSERFEGGVLLTNPPLTLEWRDLPDNADYQCSACGKLSPLNGGYSACCNVRLFPASCYEPATPSWHELSQRLMKLRADLEAAQKELDALGVILDRTVKASVL